ncbi:unnamed protein product [Pylaiella littoralis]
MAGGERTMPAPSSRPASGPFVSQSCALEPAAREFPLDDARLGEAVLRRVELADSSGGVPVLREVVESVDSGSMFMFVRMLKPAVYGSVWDALEIQLEDDGHFTVRRDERGLQRRLAVKRMPWKRINKLRGQVMEDPLHEIAALARLQEPGHPHVLKVVEAVDDGATVYLITPFVDDELFYWVAKRGASPARVVKPLFRQLVEGMRYIHSRGISHCDMSLENTLIDAGRENVYIIDFGMSVAMPTDEYRRRLLLVHDDRAAKHSYCAPEIFKNKAYDGVKVDVFAGGCMLFMMLAGFPAFSAPMTADAGFKQVVRDGNVRGLLEKYGLPPLDEEVTDLLTRMMAYEADNRPLPEEVLKHPWLASSPAETTNLDIGEPVTNTPAAAAAAAAAGVSAAAEAKGPLREETPSKKLAAPLDLKPSAPPAAAAAADTAVVVSRTAYLMEPPSALAPRPPLPPPPLLAAAAAAAGTIAVATATVVVEDRAVAALPASGYDRVIMPQAVVAQQPPLSAATPGPAGGPPGAGAPEAAGAVAELGAAIERLRLRPAGKPQPESEQPACSH